MMPLRGNRYVKNFFDALKRQLICEEVFFFEDESWLISWFCMPLYLVNFKMLCHGFASRSSKESLSQTLTFSPEGDHNTFRPLSKCSRAGWCWTELPSVHTHSTAVLSSISWVRREASQRKSPLCPLLHTAPSSTTDVIAPAHHSVGAHAGHLHFHSSCWPTPQPLHQQSRAIPRTRTRHQTCEAERGPRLQCHLTHWHCAHRQSVRCSKQVLHRYYTPKLDI